MDGNIGTPTTEQWGFFTDAIDQFNRTGTSAAGISIGGMSISNYFSTSNVDASVWSPWANEGKGGFVSAREVLSWDPTNQKREFRLTAAQFLAGAIVRATESFTQRTKSSGNEPDLIYKYNNAFGLLFSTIDLGFTEAFGAVLSNWSYWGNGAKILGTAGGSTVIGANIALTGYTVYNEKKNGNFNTHSYVNMAVTGVSALATGVGLAIAGGAIVVTSPAWGTALAVGGAVLGVGYAIGQAAGINDWIDNNWGNSKSPK